MKKFISLLLILSTALSCRNGDRETDRHDKKINKQAIALAEEYANGQLKNASREVSDQEIIVLSDSLSRVLIDPSKIVIGDFEGDTLADAIIPLYFFKGQNQDLTINLFLVNIEGKLMTVRAIEDNMKVLSVMNRVIYIELPVKGMAEEKQGSGGATEVKEFILMSDSLRLYSSSTDTIR